MIKFRPHRGGLEDAMKEYREFRNKREFIDFLKEYWEDFVHCEADISFSKSYGEDKRIGWTSWRYVLVNGCVMGMCDFCERD